MKNYPFIALSATSLLHAGTPSEVSQAETPSSAPWIKPTLEIRARFEYGSENTPFTESSTAFTVRERIGLVTQDWYGFSALIEGEFTQAVDDNYAVNGNQPGVTPFNP
ncbi:MAG: hypothetical protein ACQKBU_12190, partial [Verrucomicrobiales bacterium]